LDVPALGLVPLRLEERGPWLAEAKQVFDRMLRLNPTDNQGVRFLLSEVQAKKAWQDPSVPGGEREDRG
jgi:hypothetical protein